MHNNTGLPAGDIEILRNLAAKVAKLSITPLNLERKNRWYSHDAGEPGKPMVLTEVCGVMNDVLPESLLQCTDPWARGLEQSLRIDLYQYEVLKDDHVIEPYIQLNWQIQSSGYGVASVSHSADNAGKLGAKSWDPPIRDLDTDLGKLRQRIFTVNRDATLAAKERLENIFGDVIGVRIRGAFWWSMGMTATAIDLIGLENLMLSMFDNPAGLHRLMTFLRDDHLAFIKWVESEGLLTLNNENDYIGSGSMGYSRHLPKPGTNVAGPARLQDLWMLSESQETVGVGPDQFEEFVFPYQLSLINEFAKCYYGCCEPVHTRWHVLETIPNLARVSVSPWADETFMGEALADRIVYSKKPNPTLISTSFMDEIAVKADIRKTLLAARNCRVELIMKDVHTLNSEPQRLARWVELARETIEEVW